MKDPFDEDLDNIARKTKSFKLRSRKPKFSEWMVHVEAGEYHIRFWWNSDKVAYSQALFYVAHWQAALTEGQMNHQDLTSSILTWKNPFPAAFEVTNEEGNGQVFYYDWP